MKNNQSSKDLHALTLIDSYCVVLNDRKRIRKTTNFLVKRNKFDEKTVRIRRKSCHCQLCGEMSAMQFNMMNVPFQKKEQFVENPKPQIQESLSPSKERRSIFYQYQSLKSTEHHKLRLSLQIHGIDKNFSRQSTMKRLIAESNERSRRGSINGSYQVNTSTSDNQSVKSLNVNIVQDQSPLNIQSSNNRAITNRNILIRSKKNLMINTYFSQSARSLKTTQFSQFNKQKVCALPKLIQKKQED
ncbi:unnamed protein product (macronuclear) [Paramecium tetraurelia]|uniref:Uncharacterized protein n=1 Tax=Paramecium tetraurelia TaxID=5888 RepID=A0C2R3_PARTE|nr:uncharacterized protein GSPATT00034558001 [Paramecium tetraurelia]CAK65080.1 unnamed protein product [Paramecium tetraurelia]|eukprot:XP_001432477.1 hypothetical protein (macronuclear) [Paramecium tetraurelia strain d4-2]